MSVPPILPFRPERWQLFALAGETFAIDHHLVRSVARSSEIRALPWTPEPAAGFLPRDGVLIPVIDLRRRLGVPGPYPHNAPVIIVQGGPPGSSPLAIGLCVDALGECVEADCGPRDAPEPGLCGICHWPDFPHLFPGHRSVA